MRDQRKDYQLGQLTNALPNPIDQFQQWYNHALASDVPEPTAMTLATCTPDGQPTARVVLLKHLDQQGFVFYTNYESRKGKHLADNPQAALNFWWPPLEQQVRIEGRISKIDPSDSDEYFQSRPRPSQISAIISPQSQVVSRDALEKKYTDYDQAHRDQPLTRPDYWGGYRLTPHRVEFWQGRPGRLHDRLVYHLQPDQTWKIDRLAP